VSTLLLALVYIFLHNLLHVPVQIANKMGLQKKLSDLGPKLGRNSAKPLILCLWHSPSLSWWHVFHNANYFMGAQFCNKYTQNN
jgi:hypothetical protein